MKDVIVAIPTEHTTKKTEAPKRQLVFACTAHIRSGKYLQYKTRLLHIVVNG